MRNVADIQALLGDAVNSAEVDEVENLGIMIKVSVEDLLPTVTALKEAAEGYDFLVDLFGMDTTEDVDVTYHLRNITTGETVFVRVNLPYQEALPSIWELFPSALMPEREVAEMFDLRLSGHPNPKRLLTTDVCEPLLLKRVKIRTRDEVRNR